MNFQVHDAELNILCGIKVAFYKKYDSCLIKTEKILRSSNTWLVVQFPFSAGNTREGKDMVRVAGIQG